MDYISLLTSITRNLYRFAGPFFVVLGNVSCLLSFTIFIKKNLRKSPCSMYFAAYNISDLLFIYSSLFVSTLSYGYDITIANYNNFLCQFFVYVQFLFDSLSASLLFFASIDRILVTSKDAGMRRRSTRRLAMVCIIGSCLFWIVFHIHAFFMMGIQQLAPNYYTCYFRSSIYSVLISYYSVLKAILQPIIWAICGLWSVRNIRSVRRVGIASGSWATRTIVRNHQASTSSKDRQLLLMLLTDIVIYIVFSFMIAVVLMYEQITQYQTKDYQQLQFENFLVQMGIFCNAIPFCVGLYTKLFISKTFRNELKNLFTNLGVFCFHWLHKI